MGSKVLVDTNIAIGYISKQLDGNLMDRLDHIFDNQYHISVINKIELLGYPNMNEIEEEKFKLLVDHSLMHPIDNKTIKKTIEIRKSIKSNYLMQLLLQLVWKMD